MNVIVCGNDCDEEYIERSAQTKRTWTQKEDIQILELVKEHGASNWSLIADGLTNRSGKQCRERYHNHLQPDVKKGGWTVEEDQLIIKLQKEYGNQWAKICKSLPGRTDNAVKNRWHAAMRSNSKLNESTSDKSVKLKIPSLPITELKKNVQSKSPNSAPLPVEEFVRKYSPRFQSEMQLSDVCDLNLVSHGHHMHDHTPTTARTVDYNEEPNELAMEKDAFSGLCIPCMHDDACLNSNEHTISMETVDLCTVGDTHLKQWDEHTLFELRSLLNEGILDSDEETEYGLSNITSNITLTNISKFDNAGYLNSNLLETSDININFGANEDHISISSYNSTDIDDMNDMCFDMKSTSTSTSLSNFDLTLDTAASTIGVCNDDYFNMFDQLEISPRFERNNISETSALVSSLTRTVSNPVLNEDNYKVKVKAEPVQTVTESGRLSDMLLKNTNFQILKKCGKNSKKRRKGALATFHTAQVDCDGFTVATTNSVSDMSPMTSPDYKKLKK